MISIQRQMFFVVLASIDLVFQSCAPTFSDRLRAVLGDYRSDHSPGGAFLIACDDTVYYKEAFGVASIETGASNTTSSNFRLASVTKQFTSMAVLILKERGSVRLDQTLSEIFPHFSSVGRAITIRHLLTHTSGLLAYEDLMPDSTTVPVLDRDVLTLVQGVDSTYFPSGTKYRYSNTGYALLALVVERASGMSFAAFLKANIFEPLGMKGTVAFEKGISTVQRRSFGHSPADSGTPGFVQSDQSTTSSVLGDGGIYSSVEDLFLWHQALYTQRLVSAATLEEAMTAHAVSEDSTVKYGYGWMVGDVHGMWAVHHSGSTIGFRNFVIRVPDKRIAVIVLMNRSDGPAERIARELLDIVLDIK